MQTGFIRKKSFAGLHAGLITVIILFIFTLTAHAATTTDPLPAWQDGPVKQAIIAFVTEVTDKNNPNYVPVADRIATFDNDGTLWVEQPMYTQVVFAFDRIKQLAAQHPEWKDEKPFSIILSGDRQAISKLTLPDIQRIIAVTHTGITTDQFQTIVKEWLRTAKSARFNRPYPQLVYQPMLEAMDYLRANDFKVYIVTGGGQDFVRAFSLAAYQVPTEQVIGSAGKTQYTYQNKQPVLMKLPAVLFIDDKVGKPQAIYLFIGKKPIIAFGNSDGDRQMLEWTQSGPGKRLMLLVHHDDAAREYAYGSASRVGTFSDALMAEANKNHWYVISMKRDWKVIFPGKPTEISAGMNK
ncbi:MAG TPA: HAD family hydrolase [Gammaproteobacteria bacterium]|nr:HAD family hydrolase [Gammaproteobacteria bacterium]